MDFRILGPLEVWRRKRPLPEGEVRLRDAAHTMTFVACQPGNPARSYRPYGPSASYADGEAVTFWSGFVVMRKTACVPLKVYIDDDPSPRHVELSLGRRCRDQSSRNLRLEAGSP